MSIFHRGFELNLSQGTTEQDKPHLGTLRVWCHLSSFLWPGYWRICVWYCIAELAQVEPALVLSLGVLDGRLFDPDTAVSSRCQRTWTADMDTVCLY